MSDEGRTRAVAVLTAYFTPLSGQSGGYSGYTGGAWDSFDPSGMRMACANTFTADDLVACALLSTPISGRAVAGLLTLQRRRFEVLLEEIGPDRDFAQLESLDAPPFAAVRSLYRALLELPDIGETRATKLLARKRPRLVPIVDDVVKRHVFSGGTQQWAPLHAALRAENGALWRHLHELRDAALLGEEVTALRVFDVLAWMDGSGHADNLAHS